VILAIPLYSDVPLRRAPIVNYWLIGLCVGAFLWQLGYNQHRLLYGYGMIPAVLFGRVHLAAYLHVVPAWATLFTSMFLHGGWFHLIGNMLFLWIFGNNVEDELGHGRYLVLYLASGVAAALVQALANPASHVPMIGASGAIAGVLGAYAFYFPRANVHVFVWVVIIFRIVNVPAWALLGLWFLLQLVSGLGEPHGTPGVAFWAHVGGFIAGMILVGMLRPPGARFLQPSRSAAFATAAPRSFSRNGPGWRGSVPPAGRSYRPRGPWDRL
jgi:membrane associated rhomboid family serine protease